MSIEYEFSLDDQRQISFKVDPERAAPAADDGSSWTRLEVHTCPNCPLKGTGATHCPAALDTRPIIADFGDLISHTQTKVTVKNGDRTIVSNCDVQTALSSLLGLIMASSACPTLSRLRPLARIHLPFQSMEETQFRLVGAWLLGQLIQQRDGSEADWTFAGLEQLFDEIAAINQAFMKRLKSAASEDASFNALAMLAAGALNVQLSLDDPLEDLARFALS